MKLLREIAEVAKTCCGCWLFEDVDDVVETLTHRPGTQHVVVTGRNAPPALGGAADLVVEMTKVKHPMDAGQKGQRGIEW